MSDINLRLPTGGHPSELLSQRFDAWRKILRSLSVYLKDYAAAQNDISKQQTRLSNSVNFPFFYFGTSENALTAVEQTARAQLEAEGGNDDASLGAATAVPNPPTKHPQLSSEDDKIRLNFTPYGSGSLSDVPAAIISLHNKQAAIADKAAKELTTIVIPRLEDLRNDLSGKIKEIKGLASDFKNSVEREQGITKKSIEAYESILVSASQNHDFKNDPYLFKVNVDAQLARQVKEENYLVEAYVNIQKSGRELEKLLVTEVQEALHTYSNIITTYATQSQDLANQLHAGFLTKAPDFEWNNYVANDDNKNFIDPTTVKTRDAATLHTVTSSPLTHKIRAGYLERRSKYLKNYSKAWYVLTPSFLHEFKTSHDLQPVLSLSLNDCQISRDKKPSKSSHKFVLNTRDSSGSKDYNWVFRAENKQKLEEWFGDLSQLVALKSPIERAQLYVAATAPQEQPVAAPSAPATTSVPALATTTTSATGSNQIDPAMGPAATAAAAGAAIAAVSASTTTDSSNDTVPITKVTSSAESVSSQVSSIDEPYAAGDEDSCDAVDPLAVATGPENELDVTKLERPTIPGSFPSTVSGLKLNPSSSFADPRTEGVTTSSPVRDDNSSLFSYDLKKETHSTLPADYDFKPVDADIPVNLERKLTQTHHKDENPLLDGTGIGVAQLPSETGVSDPREAVARRRSSVTAPPNRRPSRKATGSFGVEPLTSLEPQPQASADLFFAGGLPSTTSSGELKN
ncbi:hypothetical protein D0Z00_003517 [Geotrichum galactomycetum]|uniref:Uncharacterized protein n=1 Tax=Geotrichum galactomycetum TaxID=27317 RepID=A0ACB6V117_9ASCO|nr:hypothetical protein D0Z00_003517 [Geotrichum candidum]